MKGRSVNLSISLIKPPLNDQTMAARTRASRSQFCYNSGVRTLCFYNILKNVAKVSNVYGNVCFKGNRGTEIL